MLSGALGLLLAASPSALPAPPGMPAPTAALSETIRSFTLTCLAKARDFGFDGKTLVHPDQIAPCNAAFTPSPDEIDAARRVVAAFAADPGAGVIALDGRMIERLDVAIAERILARAP